MNLLASADTLPAPGGMSAPLAFIYDLFNNPLFIFIGGLVLLGVFFWYLGSDQDKVKRNAGTIFIIGIASFSLFSLFQQGLKYGIDIAGGVSFTLSVEPNIGDDGKPIPLTDQAMEQACVILTDRLNSTGGNQGHPDQSSQAADSPCPPAQQRTGGGGAHPRSRLQDV